jgi:hypothetical protein
MRHGISFGSSIFEDLNVWGWRKINLKKEDEMVVE